MSDIVERLRQPWPPSNSEDPLMTEAAAEIERLRAALRMIRDHEPERLAWSVGYARAALEDK